MKGFGLVGRGAEVGGARGAHAEVPARQHCDVLRRRPVGGSGGGRCTDSRLYVLGFKDLIFTIVFMVEDSGIE